MAPPASHETTKLANGGRVNLDALGAIVDGHSQELAEIRNQISGLGDRVGAAIQVLSNKMDAQQQTAYNQQQAAIASGKNNWVGIIAAMGTVAGVFVSAFVVVGSMAISPIREDSLENKAAISKLGDHTVNRDDFRQYVDNMDKWMSSLRDRLSAFQLDAEDRYVSQREHKDLVDRLDERFRITEGATNGRLAALEAQGVKIPEFAEALRRIDLRNADMENQRAQHYAKFDDDLKVIRSELVPRDEHTARWAEFDNRMNALSTRINEMQHEFGSNYTLGDSIKELQSQLKELRLQANNVPAAPSIIQPRPAMQ